MMCPFRVGEHCGHQSVPDKYECYGEDSDCPWIIDLGARITGIKKPVVEQCNQDFDEWKPI